jgi:hypothetical protein
MLRTATFCLLFAAAAGLVSAEIIDRIAITVGNQVITESQIDEEIRITAFLNREKLEIAAATKKQAAARLIEQALVKREMDLSHYPPPDLSDAGAALEGVKATYANVAACCGNLRCCALSITASGRASRSPTPMCKHIIGSRFPAGNKKG